MDLHVSCLFSSECVCVCACVFITPFAGVVITYWWCCFKIQHHISRWYSNVSQFLSPSISHTHIDGFTLLVKVEACSSCSFLVYICSGPPFSLVILFFAFSPPQLHQVLPDCTALRVPIPAPPQPPKSLCCGRDFSCQMSPQPFPVHIGCHPCLTDGGRSRPHSHPVAADGCCIHDAAVKNVPRPFNWLLQNSWRSKSFGRGGTSPPLTHSFFRIKDLFSDVKNSLYCCISLSISRRFSLRVACSIVHEGAVRCLTVLFPSNYDSKQLVFQPCPWQCSSSCLQVLDHTIWFLKTTKTVTHIMSSETSVWINTKRKISSVAR